MPLIRFVILAAIFGLALFAATSGILVLVATTWALVGRVASKPFVEAAILLLDFAPVFANLVSGPCNGDIINHDLALIDQRQSPLGRGWWPRWLVC